MTKKDSSKQNQERFIKIADAMRAQNHSIELSQMFGMPCLKYKGKAFVGLFADCMVFKLTGEAHAKALTLKGSQLFDPSNKNRPMKEWVQVVDTHAAKWKNLTTQALEYIQSLKK